MEGHCKNGKSTDECCGGCHNHDEAPQEIDVKALGPEAIELAKLFEDVNDSLVGALKTRARILALLHEKSQSPEVKGKLAKVVESRHPVLLQFVFGQQ